MASKAVPLVGGFYADDARPWSSQDVCNWIPVLAEQPNTLSPAMYRTPPGLRPFVEVVGAGPVRGARNVEGRLLVVMGNQLYQISNTGVAIPRGTIPGVGPVQISHNQQGNSNQVIIVNGSAGYIYDTATLDVTRITDAGYPGAKTVDYLASYFLQVEPSGLFWFHSDLADGFAYNTLDRYESEAKPDRLVAVKSSQLEAVAFNQTTIEFFTNTGAATGTFQSKGIVIETGCASANGIVELDNSLMWLDNKGVFQRMEGYGARPISTRVLERAIAGYDWSSAIAFVWEDKGHKVAYWTFRDGFTVGYDVTTGLWHRRASYGMDRWRLSCLVNWNGKWIGGDFQTGKLYELDWDYPYDGQDPMVRRAVTGALHNEQRRMSVPSIELVFDTGGPSVEVADFPAQPPRPELSGALPDGSVGSAWAGGTYTATSGTLPYTFTSRTGTTFPGNLGPMDSEGVVAAETPTTTGMGTNIVRVTDAEGLYDELTDEFVISSSIALFGGSQVTLRPFLLLGPGGVDWNNAYAYNGSSPLLTGIGMLGGDGRWLVWPVSGGSPIYSTDATGSAWTTSAATFTSSSKTPYGCYEAVSGAFLIPYNDGIWRTVDYGVTLTSVTTIPAGAVDASPTLAMSVSLYELSVATSPTPFTAWTLQPNPHGITMSTTGIVRYGGERFLIGGDDGTGGSHQPKITFTADGTTFSAETLPTMIANSSIQCAAYSEPLDTWVAGTNQGQFLYKVGDGAWTLSAYAFGTDVAVKSLEWTGVNFVAAGNHNVSSGLGVVAYSATGISWTTAPTLEAINAQSLAVMK